MLKYKIKTNIGFGTTVLDFSEMFISPDLTYISGVTKQCYDIKDGDNVIVNFPYTNTPIHLKASVEKVTRQGYLTVNENYTINTLIGNVNRNIETDASGRTFINYNGSAVYKNDDEFSFTIDGEKYYYDEKDIAVSIKTEIYYILYNNIQIYMVKRDGVDGFVIDDVFYETISPSFIRIPTIHWIENGSVTIKGVTYVVDTDLAKDDTIIGGYQVPSVRLNKYSEPLTVLENNDTFTISDYEYAKWHNVLKVVVHIDGNEEILVNKGEIGYYQPYVEYGGNVYEINNVVKPYKYYDDGEREEIEYRNLGFGVEIDDVFYRADCFYSDQVEYPSIYDGIVDGGMDVVNNPVNIKYKYVTDNNGSFISLFINNDFGYPLAENNKIIAMGKSSYHRVNIEYENGDENPYIFFNGKKHYAKKNLCDTINVLDVDYDLTYNNIGDKAVAYINDEEVTFDIIETESGRTGVFNHDILVKISEDKELMDILPQTDASVYPSFPITEYSGVTIDGVRYRIESYTFTNDDYERIIEYANVYGQERYELNVFKIAGSNMIICEPIIGDEYFGKPITITSSAKNTVCMHIMEDFSSFSFFIFNGAFGYEPVNADMLLSMAEMPVSSNAALDPLGIVEVSIVNDSTSIKFPLVNNKQLGINREDLIINEALSDVVDSRVNDIVDMEKDVYYPVYLTKNASGDNVFCDIKEIRFNLHFRTRDKDSWKISKNEAEEIGLTKSLDFTNTNYNGRLEYTETNFNNSLVMSIDNNDNNWFVTDIEEYKNLDSADRLVLHKLPDLLGLVNFTDDDVKYRKKRISKSFLRLSFYSTNNPQDQMLLATSTIFLNENEYFNKKIKYDESELTYKNINSDELSHTISVFDEVYKNEKFTFDDESRLGCNITVKNKYETTTSSEGFYLYMFKEYSTGLKPSTVYLKIDFYHAGVGRVFPFIMPMTTVDKYIYRPLFLSNDGDVEELKKGVPMSDLNRQMFIPVNLIYNDENKRYVYYLPDNYRENSITETDNNIMEFNLFEVKIKNESNETNY